MTEPNVVNWAEDRKRIRDLKQQLAALRVAVNPDGTLTHAEVIEQAKENRTLAGRVADLGNENMRLREELAAAKAEALAVARAYDPGCEEYHKDEQVDAMLGARACAEALQTLAEYLGNDPEGDLAGGVDDVLGELEAAKAEVERLREALESRVLLVSEPQCDHPYMDRMCDICGASDITNGGERFRHKPDCVLATQESKNGKQ